HSEWDCTLQPTPAQAGVLQGGESPPTRGNGASRHSDSPLPLASGEQRDEVSFAVRMGLRFVKSLGAQDYDRIVATSRARPFGSLEAFILRTQLDEKALAALSEAGAFASFGVARREALWQARGLVRAKPVELPVDREASAEFTPLDALETIAWDYM